MIDRIASVCNSLYGKYGELFNFIVVASVIAIRPFVGILVRIDDAF